MNRQNEIFWNKPLKTYFLSPECYFIQDYLYAYLNNELNSSEKINLEHHLKNCPSCCFEYESLLEFKKELQKTLSDTDIQNLFKNKNSEYYRKERFFKNFVTFTFVLILTTSISCLFISFYKTIKTKNVNFNSEYYLQQ